MVSDVEETMAPSWGLKMVQHFGPLVKEEALFLWREERIGVGRDFGTAQPFFHSMRSFNDCSSVYQHELDRNKIFKWHNM